MSIIRQLARVANRIDSASTGTFLSKGDSTGDFTTFNYTDLSGRPTTLDSAALTSIVDSAYIQLRQTSAGSGGLDSAGITALVDSNYVVARSPAASSGFTNYEYTATAGQTTFQDSDINGNVMSYTADGIFVFYNGVLIAPTTDYTASDGSSVVLTTGADSGSHVAISKWNIASGGAGGGASATWYGDRGIFAGGGSYSNVIQYIDITQSTGNATDFGDLTLARGERPAGWSNGTYGLFGAGRDGLGRSTTIDYVTIATPSNATDFGDLTVARSDVGSPSDGTYGLCGGGYNGDLGGFQNTIDYITLATPSNASDFGDIASAARGQMSGNDDTYGLFADNTNGIDYVTIQTPANATNFGSLTIARYAGSGFSDDTRTLFCGGWSGSRENAIDYVTTATTSNATDFGDLTQSKNNTNGSSNNTYGVIGGGYTGSNIDTIDRVTIQTAGNATDYGNLTATNAGLAAASGSPS